MTKKDTNKDKILTWAYPPDKWTSDFNQTFIYGNANFKTKLFVELEESRSLGVTAYRRVGKKRKQKIKVFPNGNFAQVIKLPFKKNIIKLIQVLNGKEVVISREVNRNGVTAYRSPKANLAHKESGSNGEKSYNKEHAIMSPRRHADTPVRPYVVLIDPGHGGKEHGTHSPKGIPEKVFNLQISKILVKSLVKTCGRKSLHRTKIYLTRHSDKYVSLDDRVKFAKKKKCNLFISIHHNALPDNENPLKHRGVGVYYTHDSVKPIAKRFLDSIVRETKLKKYGFFKRNFRVTKQNFYTGILIECGFLIHPIESEIITSGKMQKKIVKGIVKALPDGF